MFGLGGLGSQPAAEGHRRDTSPRGDHVILANHLTATCDARRTSERLLDSLQRWENASTAGTPEPFIPGLRAIDAHRAIIEQAKGALVLRYRIGPYQAFAAMVRWSRVTHTRVHTIASTLVCGIWQGNPQTEIRERRLIRWLEDQLPQDDLERAQPSTAPVWLRTAA